jgi:hypothetical protein
VSREGAKDAKRKRSGKGGGRSGLGELRLGGDALPYLGVRADSDERL